MPRAARAAAARGRAAPAGRRLGHLDRERRLREARSDRGRRVRAGRAVGAAPARSRRAVSRSAPSRAGAYRWPGGPCSKPSAQKHVLPTAVCRCEDRLMPPAARTSPSPSPSLPPRSTTLLRAASATRASSLAALICSRSPARRTVALPRRCVGERPPAGPPHDGAPDERPAPVAIAAARPRDPLVLHARAT